MNITNTDVLFSGIIGGLIASMISFIGQQMVASRNLQDSLDSKSGWRKELFKTASKYEITLDDVCKIRATLRYKAKKDNIDLLTNDSAKRDFDNMTSTMIIFCKGLVDTYKSKAKSDSNQIVLSESDAEKVRIFCRYLLKHHWEYLNIRWYNFIKRFNQEDDETKYIRETLDLIREVK